MKTINKYIITGEIKLVTPLHIGSGYMSADTDASVMKDSSDFPFIPGSSLKGVIRTGAERLYQFITDKSELMKDVCFLVDDHDCNRIKDRAELETYNEVQGKEKELSDWLNENVCPICQLFGSNFMASKVKIKDAGFINENQYSVNDITTVRHSVAIDRDKGTAKDGAKYDYEVVNKDLSFALEMELTNVTEEELKLVLVVLNEMSLERIQIGGNIARGLGRVKLINDQVQEFTFSNDKPKDKLDKKERAAYLRHLIMNDTPKVNPKNTVSYYLSRFFPEEINA